MLKIKLDHVAIGAHAIADAEPMLEVALGGVKAGGHASGPPFGFMQWVYADGGRIEVIFPLGDDGFLHRFLARGGPRVHHVTFKVSSLDAMIERATAMGYGIASQDRSDPYWQEAFLHPKQAQGIVIQLVEAHERPDDSHMPDATEAPGAACVSGPRLTSTSAELARRQWGELMGGNERRSGSALVFAWPDSPLTITVDMDASEEPGPRCIEVTAPRALALPVGPAPKLGTRFVQRP
ncbi:MAG: VOC family protein [Deltaproteobacteria bacterium]|nr:VOC family protein [Deltaproteobacteria bacterium]